MHIGEQPLLVFMISKFLYWLPPKILWPAFFFGAPENENVGDLPLNTKGWEDLNSKKAGSFFLELHKMKRGGMVPRKIPEYGG